ncbi:MAG: hypothetical protein M0T84_05350 [Betaproteobacteria bacterium]|nr:hypothetical protein [Betaproteobacteria bacterium]
MSKVCCRSATRRRYRSRQAIEQQFLLLETTADRYVALYRREPADGAVHVLAFRHQKEMGG